MKTRKIDLLVQIDNQYHYLCSTTQSKTCKEAVKRFLAKHNGETYASSTGYYYISNNVKAYFDHN